MLLISKMIISKRSSPARGEWGFVANRVRAWARDVAAIRFRLRWVGGHGPHDRLRWESGDWLRPITLVFEVSVELF